jgi:hypothetical protein
MGPKPTPQHSIDRKNNDEDYSKENCRWATRSEQANNKQSNRMLIVGGKRMTVAQAAVITNLSYKCIHKRLRQGWSDEEIVSVPRRAW